MPRSRAGSSAEADASRRQRLGRAAVRPVDGASLAAFRIGFGLLMLWQAAEYLLGGRLERYFVHPTFHFKYPGFGWLEPLPEAWMHALFWLLAASSVGIALGWHYRLSAAAFTLVHTYQFLIDEAIYNNHDYLIALLGLLLIVVPAHATFSLDARRRPSVPSETVPAWALWLLRFQIAVPYVYGGLAKLDSDWLLRAQPMKIWLANPGPGEWRTDLLREPGAAYFFSWSGLLLDLLVVPALLWRKSRPFAVAAVVSFHLLNSQLFEIGVFPWLMICATVLFVEPDWPRRAGLLPRRRGPDPAKHRAAARRSPASRTGAALLALYVGLQLLLPFRHYLYPGDVDWTEEGHRFSWRMKLRDKRGELRFMAVDPASRRTIVLTGSESVLSRKQQLMMHHDPEMIRQFAHLLATGLRERGQGEMEIRVVSSISLNGLPPQPLVDPEVDLGSEPASPGPADWIVPLGATQAR